MHRMVHQSLCNKRVAYLAAITGKNATPPAGVESNLRPVPEQSEIRTDTGTNSPSHVVFLSALDSSMCVAAKISVFPVDYLSCLSFSSADAFELIMQAILPALTQSQCKMVCKI